MSHSRCGNVPVAGTKSEAVTRVDGGPRAVAPPTPCLKRHKPSQTCPRCPCLRPRCSCRRVQWPSRLSGTAPTHTTPRPICSHTHTLRPTISMDTLPPTKATPPQPTKHSRTRRPTRLTSQPAGGRLRPCCLPPRLQGPSTAPHLPAGGRIYTQAGTPTPHPRITSASTTDPPRSAGGPPRPSPPRPPCHPRPRPPTCHPRPRLPTRFHTSP